MERNRIVCRNSKALTRCLAIVCLFTACSIAYGQRAKPTRTQKPTILILGTYHMNNPGRDVLNVNWDDMLSTKRQREIIKFVSLLKRFQPTKIAIEVPAGTASLDEKYNKYLRGEYQLTRNETDQLGLRLAKLMRLPTVYGVDDDSNSVGIGQVFDFAKAHDQQALVDKAFEIPKLQNVEMTKMMQTATVTEIFKFINDPQRTDKGLQAYMGMLHVGKDKEYPGVFAATEWYSRNLTIFTNIMRITESKNDRILVIFGVGHTKILQQLIKDSGEYNLERAGKYF
ncbi:MAG: DUF5694 domain-containing protein [Pyrinomonadaceae bacterium]